MTRCAAACTSLLTLLILALAGCSTTTETGFANRSVSGHVRLEGLLTSPVGDSLGDLVVNDADSVRVHLLVAGYPRDSVLTAKGSYRFDGLMGGQVAAFARVAGPVADTTETRVVTGNVAMHDTLVLRSTGDLSVWPNPFPGSVEIRFGVPIAGAFADLRITRLDGSLIRLLASQSFAGGLHAAIWDAKDEAGSTIGPGFYWCVYTSGNDIRARLMQKIP